MAVSAGTLNMNQPRAGVCSHNAILDLLAPDVGHDREETDLTEVGALSRHAIHVSQRQEIGRETHFGPWMS